MPEANPDPERLKASLQQPDVNHTSRIAASLREQFEKGTWLYDVAQTPENMAISINSELMNAHNIDQKYENTIIHTYISAVITFYAGEPIARLVGDFREANKSEMNPDTMKDQYNNSLGRDIGAAAAAAGLSFNQISDLVVHAFRSNQLANTENDPKISGNPEKFQGPDWLYQVDGLDDQPLSSLEDFSASISVMQKIEASDTRPSIFGSSTVLGNESSDDASAASEITSSLVGDATERSGSDDATSGGTQDTEFPQFGGMGNSNGDEYSASDFGVLVIDSQSGDTVYEDNYSNQEIEKMEQDFLRDQQNNNNDDWHRANEGGGE